MFQFRAFPSYAYLFQRTIPEYCSGGFPHSEISGSTDICSSPKLIAACHVLLRLLMPRHSPCALISLTIFLVLRKNYAGHRSFSISRSNCSFTHNSTKKSVCFALPAKHPLLPCLLSHHFSIVQFSRCRLRSKTGSKHLNTFKCFDPFSGGDNRNRTDDLLRAKQALSHLSYTPVAEKIGGP